MGLFELTKSDYVNIVDTSNQSELKFVKLNAFILIGIAVFLFLSGFIGCCGSIKENRCLLGFVSYHHNYQTMNKNDSNLVWAIFVDNYYFTKHPFGNFIYNKTRNYNKCFIYIQKSH